ncbi:MAG: S41 family peptidase [Cyclobacteriaceae bacterium]|nr:S41 family peptidase [Cyclobacteriaceae bacterium]
MKSITTTLFILSLIVFTSCENFYENVPANTAEENFELLWNEFNNHYAPFEERGVDWDEQYAIFRPQVTSSTTDAELYEIFKQMLGTLNDSHVSLTIPGQATWRSNQYVNDKVDDELFDLELIKTKYLSNEYKINGYDFNTYGWIGDIGYVHMVWVTDNMYDLDAILDYFKDAKGLIIDYRHNGGGTFMWGYESMGRLVDKPRLTHRSKTKNGTGKNDYTEWFDWYIHPKGEYYNKPIVFLTDKYSISSAERMTYAFKVLPNVIHMGDSTNGSIGTKVGRELPNGWAYTIVTQKIEGFDGNFYEGVGIPPDVYVKNTLSEMQSGIDRTLEEAINQLK